MTNTSMFITLIWMCLTNVMLIMLIDPLHPSLMILFMLFFNSLLCLNMNFWKSNLIIPIIFFLIMTSGVFIIFLYFSSLISNEQTWPYYFNLGQWILLINIAIIYTKLVTLYKSYSPYLNSFDHENMMMLKNTTNLTDSLMMLYMYPWNNLTLMSMIYLLIALLSLIKLCSPKNKTLRKLN